MAATRSIKSGYLHSISTDFNKSLKLVLDQGVGGSNHLSPTIKINSLQDSGVDQLVSAQVHYRSSVGEDQITHTVVDLRSSTKSFTAVKTASASTQR
jgi:hypothetical protein